MADEVDEVLRKYAAKAEMERAERAPLSQFGEDAETWNVEGDWRGEGDKSGNPGVLLFSGALSVWAGLQNHSVSVGEAAMTFNATPELIIQAVEEHPWMYFEKINDPNKENWLIEHDGE